MSNMQGKAQSSRRFVAKKANLLAQFGPRGFVPWRRPRKFGKGLCCSNHCGDAFVGNAQKAQQKPERSVLKRFVVAFVAFVGLIALGTFAMAVLAAAPARREPRRLSDCDHNLADPQAIVAAMRSRFKGLRGHDRSEICTAALLASRIGRL
jgi:hypothetical protein